MRYLLGIDLGSSSVKVALVDSGSGQCAASASAPASEAPIKALKPGWAEQNPDDWWQYLRTALAQAMAQSNASANDIAAIGISYQMHGLVCLDHNMQPLRDAIIWCDSRGVPYGEQAFRQLGETRCLEHLLNSPGNFTASKLAWVRDNEPDLFGSISCVMLPGDWLALRMTGEACTTACGLSEMMLWDYPAQSPARFLLDHYGIPSDILPPLAPTFGIQGKLRDEAAADLGLHGGIPVAYRAGDQPNNALSLGVFQPGEVAATAGTSGVVYGVRQPLSGNAATTATANAPAQEPRVNTFLHVNHNLGLMHCINGCGILNSWLHRNVAADLSYDEMNRLAADAPAGCDGLTVIPFGNGAERVLLNRDVGCSLHGLNFNRHTRSHMLRAAQEGIAFALMYGIEAMQQRGMEIGRIHAGRANMFLSPVFRRTLSDISGASIDLYDTDGAAGAARAAGIGAGIYADTGQAFETLHLLSTDTPSGHDSSSEAYYRWKSIIEKK